jgi:hypothetical protein
MALTRRPTVLMCLRSLDIWWATATVKPCCNSAGHSNCDSTTPWPSGKNPSQQRSLSSKSPLPCSRTPNPKRSRIPLKLVSWCVPGMGQVSDVCSVNYWCRFEEDRRSCRVGLQVQEMLSQVHRLVYALRWYVVL